MYKYGESVCLSFFLSFSLTHSTFVVSYMTAQASLVSVLILFLDLFV